VNVSDKVFTSSIFEHKKKQKKIGKCMLKNLNSKESSLYREKNA